MFNLFRPQTVDGALAGLAKSLDNLNDLVRSLNVKHNELAARKAAIVEEMTFTQDEALRAQRISGKLSDLLA